MSEQLKRGPLSDRDILRAMQDGDIKITPYTSKDAWEVMRARDTLQQVGRGELDPARLYKIDQDHNSALLLNKMLQPSSIDVVLDKTISRFNSSRHASVTPWREQPDLTYQQTIDHGETFVLHPEHFILGSTWERISISGIVVARFEGKSSLGRIGLATHITAGFIDPGWDGNITVEMKNNNELPIEIRPGMKIGQFAFEYLGSESLVLYGDKTTGNHYRGQTESTPARFDDFHITDIYGDNKMTDEETVEEVFRRG